MVWHGHDVHMDKKRALILGPKAATLSAAFLFRRECLSGAPTTTCISNYPENYCPENEQSPGSSIYASSHEDGAFD